MGLCGCYPACACMIVAGNNLISIVGDGDPATGGWVISGVETAFSMVNADGGIEVIAGGPYGHSPQVNLIVEDSPTISLSVSPANGLQANLLVAPGVNGGVPTGTPLMWLTDIAPSGYIMATGPNAAGYVPIANEPALFGVIGHQFSGGVDPMDGTFLVEIPDDSFFKTQGAYGNIGDPNLGAAQTTLGVANLPQHDHGVNDPQHDHPGTVSIDAEPNHNHNGAGANHDFLVENGPDYIYLDVMNVNLDPPPLGGAMRFTSNGTGGGNAYLPNREPNTVGAGGHSHAGSTIDIQDASTGVTVLNQTTGLPLMAATPFTNLPPFWIGNIIIKT